MDALKHMDKRDKSSDSIYDFFWQEMNLMDVTLKNGKHSIKQQQ